MNMGPKKNKLSSNKYKKLAKIKDVNLSKMIKNTNEVDLMFKSELLNYIFIHT